MFDPAREFITFKTSPHLAGVELYMARLIDVAFAPHVHEAYSLGAIETGVERFRYRGAEHLAPADTLVTLNADEIHTGQAEVDAGWTYQMLYIEPELMREMCGAEISFEGATVHDPALARAFRRAFRQMWQAPDDVSFVSSFTGLIDTIAARYARGQDLESARFGARARAMRRVRDCVEARLDGPLRIETLAQEAGLSLFHFVRVFSAAFGCTPHQYIQARRTVRAKSLLTQRVSPGDAAAAVGLVDQSHLTRWFKRSYGVTPAQYQQQIGTRPLA